MRGFFVSRWPILSSPIELLRQMPCQTAIAVVAVIAATGWLQQDAQIKALTVHIDKNEDKIAEIRQGYVTRQEMTDTIRAVEDSIGNMVDRIEKTQATQVIQTERAISDRIERLEKSSQVMAEDIKRLLERD